MVKFAHAQPSDIMVLSSFPMPDDLEKGAFQSRGAYVVRNMLKALTNPLPRNKQPLVDFMYAVKCCTQTVSFKLKKEDIDKCRANLFMRLDIVRPKLIVAMGADATKALGFTEPLPTLRGNFHQKAIGGKMFNVLVTLHPAQIQKSPGYTSVLQNDLAKAVQYITDGLMDQDFEIDTPVAYEDVIASLQKMELAIRESERDIGKPLLVAVDTETTSLTPYNPEDRVIAISLSYKENYGLAYPWQHRAAVYTDAQYGTIKEYTQMLLSDPFVRIAEHNAKFDQQWLNKHYGLGIHQVSWDTLLVEHLLDEDKKGEYGLKALTPDYFPGAGKYEKELAEELAALKAERQEKTSQANKLQKEVLRDAYVEFWLSQTEEAKLRMLSYWVSSGFVGIAESAGMTTPGYVNKKGVGKVLTKKYQDMVTKVLKRVPDSELSMQVDLEDPDDVPLVTYEDLSLDVLLKYAAIDAIMTRKIMAKQIARFTEEAKIIARTEQVLGRKLQTLPVSWALSNITLPMSRAITDMEYEGVRIDRERCKEYIATLEGKIEESMEGMIKNVGYKFNPASDDLLKILYEDKKLPVLKRSDKTGAPSADAETIKFLADDHDDPFLQELLSFRKMEKCKNTYLKNWLKMSELDGRLHGQYNQNGTATYRLSSFLQIIPAWMAGLNMKACLLPDDDEHEFYDLDIRNAEMRVLTAYSLDEALIDAFLKGMCLHCLTGEGISNYSYDEIYANKEDKTTDHYRVRQIGKKVNEIGLL
jgi:uracil-DNA glycosylase family 4